jgi:hypothetical protein
MRVLLAALIAIGVGSLALPNAQAFANPISVDTATLNIFRTIDQPNDVHIPQGDNFQFGANINGGSLGTSIAGIFTSAGSITPTFMTSLSPCGPLVNNANFCASVTPFSVVRTNGSWQVDFRNGANTTALALPSVSVIPVNPIPFPSSVTITAASTTPTISWTLPPSISPDAFRINLYDKSLPCFSSGCNSVFFSANLNPTASSYTVPASVGLVVGGNYAIQLEVIDTRDGGPIPPGTGNADILTRSSSYFDFSPPANGGPPVIQLPTIFPNGVYHFNVGSVGPTSVTFIDPTVAVGYIYDIGQGDPNFASVLLPDVGGGQFDLSYLVNGNEFTTMLAAGIEYFFGAGGVDEFTVTGIDPAAEIDPTNALAFITGLTFVSDGPFTGTMTPITEVATTPEPGSVALFASSLLGLLLFRRGRRSALGS